jgi:hypothetical protein
MSTWPIGFMNLVSVKWLGTILCLIGIGLTSLNIYPLNIIFGLVGSGLWAASGYAQDDTPLFLVEIVAASLYLFGLIAYIYQGLRLWGVL